MAIRRFGSMLRSRLGAWAADARASRRFRGFLRGESGAIAIYFGLSCIVFIGVAGLAVDAARGYLVKARLSEAIDAAALAGGKALQTANDPQNNKVKADALAFFNANFPNGAMGANVVAPTVTIDQNKTKVTVSSSASIPTTLMKVLGFQEMNMVAAATVARAQSGLDVVFSFDISHSMCIPNCASKLGALKSNATALVDSLFKPFTTGGQVQTVTVNGVDYSLLNIGVVPWSAKVNVRTYPATSNGTITGPTGGSFTNPTGRKYGGSATLPGVYKAANSEVPLLLNPNDSGNNGTVPGGWTGCVYARYTDDGDQSNDADTTLGTGGSWPGWEPVPSAEGNEGGNGFFDCYGKYWNSNDPAPYGFFQQKQPPTSGWWPQSGSLRDTTECAKCPSIGILPLQTDAATVTGMINNLVDADATDAPQGLFWAWEVLMPGAPFDQAKVNPPFQRAQAIVFMTDGENQGSNGDAYHGWFGPNVNAGTTTAKGDITLPDGSTVKNNLNNRLLQLAQNIKGSNPLDPSAVKIYVIQYQSNTAGLADLLKKVATQDKAPFYYFAPGNTALATAFNEIAASLSALRIIQ